MAFTSHLFLLVFLPLAAAGHALFPERGRRAWLLACGLAFYAWASVAWLALLSAMAVITFLAGRLMDGDPSALRRRLGLALTLSNLAVLVAFKAAGALAPAGHAGHWALPLGLSFYTFNLLSYALDVYWRRAPAARSVLDFAVFASFFPTISSGPLLRFETFAPQLGSRPDAPSLERGVFTLTMGLAKKALIADPLGRLVDPMFAGHDHLQMWGAWLAILGYHLQVYFDFSGYSDMAMGAARILGLEVPANFDAPYTSRSVTEFWQRWHITLSRWFRDYVFSPLAFSLRRGGLSGAASRSLALVVTFTLVGLWHAASGPYLLWGLYQGVLLSLHARARDAGRRPWPPWAGRLATFAALMAGWVILRSSTLAMAASLAAAMTGRRGVEAGPAAAGFDAAGVLFLAALLALTNVRREAWQLEPRRGWAHAVALAALATASLLALTRPAAFLYLQF